MQEIYGEDVLWLGGPKYPNPKESNIFVPLSRHVDMYFPPCKRTRVSAPFLFYEELFKQQQTTIDSLPDECLFEILRRVSGTHERGACASVSKRWLSLLSTIHSDEKNETEDLDKTGGCLKRCLKAEKANDIRLAAIAVGASSRGGLAELSLLGDEDSRVTDFGLKTVARGCPTITSLTLWNLTSIGDKGLIEIAKECHLLEKLDLAQCPTISDKSLVVIANNCPNLTSLSIESCANIKNEGLQEIGRSCANLRSVLIKNCPQVGDQAVAGLLSSGCSLTRLKLQALNISDMSLAVIGQYGVEVVDLALGGLCNVTEKGFWVMGNGQGLQKLKLFTIYSCCGVTDLGLDAIGKGCPNMKQFILRKSGFVTDKGIVSFTKSAQSLEILMLDECPRITQNGLFRLVVVCRTLKGLSLANCSGIQDFAVKPLSFIPSCTSLVNLSIRNCPGFGNASLTFLGKLCSKLQIVVFAGLHQITDEGFAPFVQNHEPGLVKIDLSGCVNITDKLVSEIARVHGATLQVLNLDGCRSLTDASLFAVSQNCVSLSELDVSRSLITDLGIAALVCLSQPTLKILSISGCDLVSDKSVPFLTKMGVTLFALNIMSCSGLTSNAVDFMMEQIWKCNILY